MRRLSAVVVVLLASAPASAAPIADAAGASPERVTFGSETDAALRIRGGVPLKASIVGPGTLLAKLFLELPRKGAVAGSTSAAVLIDGRPRTQISIRRRRAPRGALPAAGKVPSVAAAFSLELAEGSHVLEIRLPAGANGGAVLDFQAASPVAVPLVAAAPRTVDAFTPPEAAPPIVSASSPEPATAARKHFRLAARFGAVVPSSELSAGAAGGLDFSWILPVGRGIAALDQKLRLSLGVGDSMLYEQGPKIIQGRGLDPNFAEYASVQPIDLSLVYTLPFGWRAVDVYVGAGYALNLVQATFQSFGRQSQQAVSASGALFQLGVEVALGPGAVVIEARQSVVGADLGNLGSVGTDTLSGTTLGLGYAYLF